MPDKKIEVDFLPRDIEKGAVYSINQNNPNTYTHGMFKYPCKFIPEIPRWAINRFLDDEGTVLDPFAGSGTTILEAVLNGHNAYSAEIDDIAKLITKVKTTKFSSIELVEIDKIYEILKRKIKNENLLFLKPKISNLSHWFSAETTNELGRLKATIDNVENKDIRDFFYICFVSIIKKVSYADDTSPKPYVSNKVKKTPPEVSKEFQNTFLRYRKMIQELSEIEILGSSYVLNGDAISFQINNEVDIAITSPPYINAFDYGRIMRLENIWMEKLTENSLRKKKKDYIGTEKINVVIERENLAILEKSDLLKQCYNNISKADEKRALVVKKFFEDMEKNLEQVHKALRPNGYYIIVIGNSNIRKIEIESWKVIKEIAEKLGYSTETYFSYEIRNPYIRIPRQGQGGKISMDYVIVLRR